MCDNHQRVPVLLREAEEELKDLRPGVAVQVTRRFIRQQQAGGIHERTRQRHALLLAAGKLQWRVGSTVGKAHQRQQLHHAGPAASMIGANGHGRQHDVLHHVHLRQQVVGLKDKADLLRPQAAALTRFQRIERLAVHAHVARVRAVQSTQQMQQRAFACAAAPDNGHALARAHSKRRALQDRHGLVGEHVAFVKISGCEKRGHGVVSSKIAIGVGVGVNPNPIQQQNIECPTAES